MEDQLRVEKVSDDVFRGNVVAVKAYTGSLLAYGGHLLAHSVAAAYSTVISKEMHLHSLHSYFVRAGTSDVPVLYSVNRRRDGRSFAIRYVTAKQSDKIIFVCECSFQRAVPSFGLLTLSPVFPKVPGPECLPTAAEAKRHASSSRSLSLLDPTLFAPSIECRVAITGFNLPVDSNNKHQYFMWLRNAEPIHDRVLAHCMAVFISDISVLGCAMSVHEETMIEANLSLDHSLWFHDWSFVIDDWLLYEMEAVSSSGDRTLVFGRMWSRDGRLLLSSAQECLVRINKKNKSKL